MISADCISICRCSLVSRTEKLRLPHVRKGYLKRIQSNEDARMFYLEPTAKFMKYYKINTEYLETVVRRCKARFSEEDYNRLSEYLHIINTELMPELNLTKFKRKTNEWSSKEYRNK